MDEIEHCVVGQELALIDVATQSSANTSLRRSKPIRGGPIVGITEEERVTRVAAIDMLEDTMRRFEPGAMGMFLEARGVG